MNRQTLALIVTAFWCTVITPLGYAKSGHYLADTASTLKRKFSTLCDKNGYNHNRYEGNPQLIKLQGYKSRPKQRRKLMGKRLNRVRDQFLSFPPARHKDAALSNLEERVNLIKKQD